ncbi:unnamed protein product [Hymenolepis diminuta]|uniref:Uncharacterized protein n=1 Tax=Hymenolepis diminuta TaxID=6216 RepID=A0A564Z8P1_HYMDI|nr:unnamed protein product [Hymenolepis diminuta]
MEEISDRENLPRKSDDEDETTTKRQKCGRAFGEILRDFSHFCPVSFVILTIFVLGIFLLVIFSDAIFSWTHDYLRRFTENFK